MYSLIAIGGTFDRLHRGHRAFLIQAFRYGKRVLIGLTSDRFAKAKISNFQFSNFNQISISNFQMRKKELENFLKKKKLLDRAEIVKIDDVYGPAAKMEELEALVITSDTLEGGRKVNKKRRQLGLKPLKLLKLPLIIAQDQKRISSTRIRLGEIDRWGRAFAKQMQISNLKSQISNKLRLELKKPLGILINGNPDDLHSLVPELKKLIGKTQNSMIITVGDEVTKLANEIDLMPQLAIVDFVVSRKKKYTSLADLSFSSFCIREIVKGCFVKVKNPPGHISVTLTSAILGSLKKYISSGRNQVIRVIGEEDLSGVPAILLSPLGTLVLYGQPGEGIVAVEVTEEKKRELVEMMDL